VARERRDGPGTALDRTGAKAPTGPSRAAREALWKRGAACHPECRRLTGTLFGAQAPGLASAQSPGHIHLTISAICC